MGIWYFLCMACWECSFLVLNAVEGFRWGEPGMVRKGAVGAEGYHKVTMQDEENYLTMLAMSYAQP